MRILFMGTPDFAAVSLKELIKNDRDIVGVFTQPDKPVGRKHVLEKPAVKAAAESSAIPVYQPVKLRNGTALNIIRELDPELIVVVAYGRILPKDILDYPKYGCVNIHASILPKYRGAAPIQWAIINGEAETGVTAMYMSEGLDEGDIIDVRRTPIHDGETSGELFERLAPIGAELLNDTISSIESGNVSRTPQNSALATFAPPLSKENAAIDWTLNGKAIVSKINGLNPWPVAVTELNGINMKIFKAKFISSETKKPCGTVSAADRNGILVSCNDGAVLITELQVSGGKRMSAGDYLRGHPICP